MSATNQRRKTQLGMPFGTASNRLRRTVMFALIQVAGMDTCCKCAQKMTEDDFTIEHLFPWLDVDPDLFWDLNNIAFSHATCNRPHRGIPPAGHGSIKRYERGCRCKLCILKMKARNKKDYQKRNNAS